MSDMVDSTNLLGIVVMVVAIGIPFYIVLGTTMLGGPKVGSVRRIFIGTLLTIVTAAIVFTWLAGAILSLIVPK